MKDCILSLFWPRRDIVGFFEKHGCTKAEIGPLEIEGENALKRHEVVDALFNALAARPDDALMDQYINLGLQDDCAVIRSAARSLVSDQTVNAASRCDETVANRKSGCTR